MFIGTVFDKIYLVCQCIWNYLFLLLKSATAVVSSESSLFVIFLWYKFIGMVSLNNKCKKYYEASKKNNSCCWSFYLTHWQLVQIPSDKKPKYFQYCMYLDYFENCKKTKSNGQLIDIWKPWQQQCILMIS